MLAKNMSLKKGSKGKKLKKIDHMELDMFWKGMGFYMATMLSMLRSNYIIRALTMIVRATAMDTRINIILAIT